MLQKNSGEITYIICWSQEKECLKLELSVVNDEGPVCVGNIRQSSNPICKESTTKCLEVT
jgi:hypothetical protein